MVRTRQMTRAAAMSKTGLTDMPLEIFDRICWYTGYKEVSNMRLVMNTDRYFDCLTNVTHSVFLGVYANECSVSDRFEQNILENTNSFQETACTFKKHRVTTVSFRVEKFSSIF